MNNIPADELSARMDEAGERAGEGGHAGRRGDGVRMRRAIQMPVRGLTFTALGTATIGHIMGGITVLVVLWG